MILIFLLGTLNMFLCYKLGYKLGFNRGKQFDHGHSIEFKKEELKEYIELVRVLKGRK